MNFKRSGMQTLAIRCALILTILDVSVTCCVAQNLDADREQKLVVGIRNIPPFAIKGEDDTWSGVSIGLWKSVAEQLSLAYEFREFPQVSGLLSACESGAVDVGVAAMTVTADREKHMDFSMPFYTSGIGVAVRKSDNGGILSGISTLLSVETFLAIATGFAILLLVGTLSWVFERKVNSSHFDRKTLRGIGDGIWFAAVTMTTVGYGDKSPKTVPGRLLALVWMFSALVLISLFTAAAASALTEARLGTRIERPEDLLSLRCGTTEDSTSGRFLLKERIGFRNYESLDEAIDALSRQEIDACIYDAPVLRYFAHRKFGATIEVLPIRFQSASYAFVLPPDSPLREQINRALLAEIESDGWPDHVERLLGR